MKFNDFINTDLLKGPDNKRCFLMKQVIIGWIQFCISRKQVRRGEWCLILKRGRIGRKLRARSFFVAFVIRHNKLIYNWCISQNMQDCISSLQSRI